MDEKIKKYLLQVARNTIAGELGLKTEIIEEIDDPILNEKRGVFVTLEIEGQLRGCIGNIMPVYPLEKAVKQNAISAAFGDPRFSEVSREEFNEIEIEISVLTVPKKLEYKDAEDLLKKLKQMEDGVVLKKGYYEATYLPQVWEKVADKEDFLSSLCMKAGMNMNEWRKGDVEVLIYNVEMFKEEKRRDI